jgi:flagellar biosynthesis protein FlhA
MGYTVVDPVAVVVAHLTEVIKENAHTLLGRQEVRGMVDSIKESHPALVEELIPGLLNLGDIQKVLQNLLAEGVPVRDLVLIFETMADWAGVTRDPDQLTERVRAALGRTIIQHLGLTSPIRAITLAPDLEQQLLAATDRRSGSNGGQALDPSLAQTLVEALQREADNMAATGLQPLLVCPPVLRPILRRISAHAYAHMTVLSYAELDPRLAIEPVGVIRG